MIEVKNLVKEFKSEDGTFMALDDLSFKVNRGEIFGVIGLSETGKSTLVRCINRLEEPTSGDITIDGKSIIKLSEKELRAARKDIGLIFQYFIISLCKRLLQKILSTLLKYREKQKWYWKESWWVFKFYKLKGEEKFKGAVIPAFGK